MADAAGICHSSVDDADCTDSDVVTPSGTRLPVTPRLKLTATARYSWPVGPGEAHVQGSVSHRSSASSDIRQDIDGSGTNPNDFLGRLHSSTLVDVFLGYDWQKYSAEIFATNLFDERDELARFVECSICTETKIFPGRPRTIGIRLGARF